MTTKNHYIVFIFTYTFVYAYVQEHYLAPAGCESRNSCCARECTACSG